MYLIEKQEHILDQCFALCTERSKPGSTLTGRQVTCSGTPPLKLRELQYQDEQRLRLHVRGGLQRRNLQDPCWQSEADFPLMLSIIIFITGSCSKSLRWISGLVGVVAKELFQFEVQLPGMPFIQLPDPPFPLLAFLQFTIVRLLRPLQQTPAQPVNSFQLFAFQANPMVLGFPVFVDHAETFQDVRQVIGSPLADAQLLTDGLQGKGLVLFAFDGVDELLGQCCQTVFLILAHLLLGLLPRGK